jgi:hypothetical protein
MPADWERIGQLLEQYADLPLGTVDALVVAACGRPRARELATLDRRQLGAVRHRHCPALMLPPR